jgi:hypothetical protein
MFMVENWPFLLKFGKISGVLMAKELKGQPVLSAINEMFAYGSTQKKKI